MKLLVAVTAVLAVFPSSSQAFQLPRFPGASSPPPQQQQEQQKPGSYTKTSPVLKAAVGLLTGGLNNVVRRVVGGLSGGGWWEWEGKGKSRPCAVWGRGGSGLRPKMHAG